MKNNLTTTSYNEVDDINNIIIRLILLVNFITNIQNDYKLITSQRKSPLQVYVMGYRFC